jgi:hypothetical protein
MSDAEDSSDNVSDGVKIDCWKFELHDTWRASERQTLDAASVASATDASGDPAFWNNNFIRRGTSINTCWPALGSHSWHFDILVSILS